MSLISRTGGLFYHFKAWRYRQTLWAPHLHRTTQWLKTWKPKTNQLVLIGSSGGYAFDQSAFLPWKKITLIDPDPLAPFIFKRNFPNLKIDHSRENFFSASGFKKLAMDFPNSSFLFCNILGQLPLLGIHLDEPKLMSSWITFLQAVDWASFHDLWSTEAKASWQISRHRRSLRPNLQESVAFFSGNTLSGEVQDHLTQHLFPLPCEREEWLWSLTPRQIHCIEGVRPSKQVAGT